MGEDTMAFGHTHTKDADSSSIEVFAHQLASAVINADIKIIDEKIQAIKDNPELAPAIITKVRNITEKECQERKWGATAFTPSVSALELSAWTGDFTITEKLLKFVPITHKTEALNQLINVRDKGLEHGERMAPTRTLIQHYNNYNDHFSNLPKNLTEEEKHRRHLTYCINTIGKAQLRATAFILQWLCDDAHRDLFPNYDRAPTRKYQLLPSYNSHDYHRNDGKNTHHSLRDKRLGELFYLFITDGGTREEFKHAHGWPDFSAGMPASRLETICKISVEKLNEQIKQLQKEINLLTEYDTKHVIISNPTFMTFYHSEESKAAFETLNKQDENIDLATTFSKKRE